MGWPIWAYGLPRHRGRVLVDAERCRPVVEEIREVLAKPPVLRSTVARSTPGRVWMARSTLATEEAQVIPPTPRVAFSTTGS